MNRDVERSSNAMIDVALSAGGWIRQVPGRSQRLFFGPEEEEQVHREPEVRRRRLAHTLSKRSIRRVLNMMHWIIDEGCIVLQGLRPPLIPSTRLEYALSQLLNEIAPAGSPRFRIVVTGQPKTLRFAIEEQIYLIG